MTGKSGKGTARQTIRVDADLWARFGAFCEEHGSDRSAVVRACIEGVLAGDIEVTGPATDETEA